MVQPHLPLHTYNQRSMFISLPTIRVRQCPLMVKIDFFFVPSCETRRFSPPDFQITSVTTLISLLVSTIEIGRPTPGG